MYIGIIYFLKPSFLDCVVIIYTYMHYILDRNVYHAHGNECVSR